MEGGTWDRAVCSDRDALLNYNQKMVCIHSEVQIQKQNKQLVVSLSLNLLIRDYRLFAKR